MKKLIVFLLPVIFAVSLAAQEASKYDVVLKNNGDELTGTVKEITDDEIKFVHKGETLVYTLKKSDVFRITFASGRTEMFSKQSSPEKTNEEQPSQTTSEADRHNKVAILPFSFIRDNQSAGEEMGYKVQEETYAFLVKNSPMYTYLDPRTTNALLIKAGITKEKMMGYTMEELCKTLGVEFIVDGTVTQNKGAQTNYTSQNYKASEKSDSKSSTNNNAKVSGSSHSTSTQKYENTITINIFNDKNSNIFTKTHKAAFASTDGSYNTPLQYVLKRCPLYSK